jgi:uroporphyrinogen-III synthase
MPKVLITRPRKQAQAFADVLAAAGFTPVFFPVIQIRPMDDLSSLKEAIKDIDKYEWVIFSSTNAVDVFFDALEENPQLPKVAAVGSKTEASLRSRGVAVNFVPNKYVGEAILSGLGDLKDKWVLLPRAEVAREILPKEILAAGGIVHEIAIYQTLPEKVDKTGLDTLRSGVDVVTFTCPSTVQNFVHLLKNADLDPFHLAGDPVFACIGPVTKEAAEKEGFSVAVMPKKHTVEGLVESLKNHDATYE